MAKLRPNSETIAILLSISVQVPLAIFLGHSYDDRAFLDAGYLVSSGLNPYLPHLINVFHNPVLTGINPIIGYPPIWALLLGLIYRLTFNFTSNLFLYNFGIKIPIIAANIGLAYTTKTILQKMGASPKKIQVAWLFLLFNPFLLLTTAAWGQFDTLVALLSVASLYFLSKSMIGKAAILLSLGIVLKPIALPLLGLPLVFSPTQTWRKSLTYISISAVTIATLWFLPFDLLGWAAPSSASQVGSYFQMAGAMTVFNILKLVQNTAVLPAGLEFLGFLWIPALMIGYYYFYRNPPKNFKDLVQSAIILLLIFFFTRTWLSEQNMNLIFPLALIALPVEKINFRNFNFLWVIPLAFMFFNTSLTQLFFIVSWPSIVSFAVQIGSQISNWLLIGRFILALALQIFAWN